MSDHQVVIAGGGPVGLATAVELGRRGIDVLVVEPRATVSHARPRCKTINVRTMEHLSRWGIADDLRRRAPLTTDWSQDVVFCTSLAGRELSRFSGVLGLAYEGERFPELGQQAPQYVLEELLRDTVRQLPTCTLETGWALSKAQQDGTGVHVTLTDGDAATRTVTCDYLVGCDGPRSSVREQIGARYDGEHALRPNFGMVFEAPELWPDVRHGPAVQYWVLNAACPALLGPIDTSGTWWMIAFGVDRETGERTARDLIDAAAGTPTDATVLSTDPWTARMQIADRMRDGRIFLAGDAAHLNPPFGGHGLNTGIGDAVDLGWKLAAVLQGWGGPALLDSYEAERRPVQELVIQEATANMANTSAELMDDGLDVEGPLGDSARQAADKRIQATKAAEFHALDLVLDVSLDSSPLISHGADRVAGSRLPHAQLDSGSLYDRLGTGFTLLCLTQDARTGVTPLTEAAAAAGVPLTVVDLGDAGLRSRYGADLVLVRPDQYVAWAGDRLPAADQVLARVTARAGAA
ncbi:FAD-dependent monooxygenase [Streptomyces sp. NPDC102360]|uniref:FAD-dependent monooxygenase n=1 Tax=Streptomyces sp. NPDC102360 TaxID=3366160 RepID=UPI00380EAA68